MKRSRPGRERIPVEKLEKAMYESQTDRTRRLRLQGMCISCGIEKAVPGRSGGKPTYCQACYDRHAEQAKASNRRSSLGISKKLFTPAELPEVEVEPDPHYAPGSLRDRLAKRRRAQRDEMEEP